MKLITFLVTSSIWFAVQGKRCKFPFYYKGVEYNDCTSKDSYWLWCSLTTEYVNAWKYCDASDINHGDFSTETTSTTFGDQCGIYNNRGYVFHNVAMTHTEAVEFCSIFQMKLTTVHDHFHNKWLRKVSLGIHSGHWWLGLTDLVLEGHFINADNSPVSYKSWHRGQPDNYRKSEHCVVLGYWNNELWNDFNCLSKSRVICENSKPTCEYQLPAPTTLPFGDKCMPYMNRGHLFHKGKKSFDQAVNYCKALGMNLVKVNDSSHNFWVHAANKNMSRHFAWIDASDRLKEGEWRHNDGSLVTFTNWKKNQPDNWYDNEDCAHIGFHGMSYWNDLPCYSALNVICQSNKPNCDTSSYIVTASNGEKCGRYNNKGYLFVNLPMPWSQASHYCGAMGMSLTKIHSSHHNRWIMHAAHSVQSGYWWIGASDHKSKGTFRYTDDSLISYSKWAANSHSSYLHDCVHIGADGQDYWGAYNCNKSLRFICEASTVNCDTNNAIIKMRNRDTCGRYDSESYLFHNTEMNHDLAQYYCSSVGMSLAPIDDDDRNTFVYNMAFSIEKGKWWIGPTDKATENVFRDLDNKIINYTKWYANEPNNLHNEDCVHIGRYDNEYWNDIACASKSRVICKSNSLKCDLNLPNTIKHPNGDVCGTFNSKGYYFHPTAMSYEQAAQFCSKHDMRLTKVYSGEHNIWLKHIAFSVMPGLWWLGINDRNFENRFRNHDGTHLVYTNWHSGEPNNYHNEDCVHIGWFSSETWNDIACQHASYVICESDKINCTTNIPDTTTTTLSNGDHCAAYQNKGYLFHNGMKTYSQAANYCSSKGMALTKIYTENHNIWMNNIALGIASARWWIGVTDSQEEGVFRNLDGSPITYTNWRSEQPDDWQYNEDCVHIGFHNKAYWNDLVCSTQLRFICESSSTTCF